MDTPTTAVETKVEVTHAATEPTVEVKAETDAVDYKAELEASLARETKLTKDNQNYRKGILIAKGKKPDDGSVIVADPTELERIIDERVAKKATALQVDAVKPSVDAIIGQLSVNPDEQALIKHIYDTRISHTGTDAESLKSDLEEAQLLANKKSVKKTISELRVAAQHRPTPGMGAGASTATPQLVADRDFTPAQLEYFKKRNLDPEKVRANLGRIPALPVK